MNKNNIYHRYFFTPLFTILVKGMGLFKVSFIIGSWNGAFSGLNLVAPLAGAFGGLIGATGVFLLGMTLKFFILGWVPFKILAYHVPGYFASLYWINRSFWFRVGVPILCMILFISHPVGMDAYTYSFYWLIPVTLFILKKKNVFLESLGSTFIAHAVGSVIWIYAIPMTSAVWLGLMPIVFFERLFFAIGMTVMHAVITQSSYYFPTFIASLRARIKKNYA